MAPRTRTFSPPRRGARQASGSHPASPAMPSPAATAGSAPVGHLDGHGVANRDARGHRPVPGPADATAEHPDEPAVAGSADGLAAGDVGELGVPRRQDAARHGEIDRVDRRREHVHGLAGRLVDLRHLGSRADLTDHRSLHGSEPNRSGTADAAGSASFARAFLPRPEPPPTHGAPTISPHVGRVSAGFVPISRHLENAGRVFRPRTKGAGGGRRPHPSARPEPAEAGRGAYPPLKGRMSGFIPANTPSGFGYQSHTCRVTRSGCQKLNLAPLVGLVAAQDSWLAWNSNVPSL